MGHVSSPRSSAPPSPRRAKHLIDFDNPRPAPARGAMTLTQVQRWVMSVLAVTTVFHMAAGLVVAAFYVGEGRADAQIGLLVIAGLFGVLAVFIGLAIHGRRPVSWWLLLGWVPTLVGAYILFWR
jgi:hypothetical protein